MCSMSPGKNFARVLLSFEIGVQAREHLSRAHCDARVAIEVLFSLKKRDEEREGGSFGRL